MKIIKDFDLECVFLMSEIMDKMDLGIDADNIIKQAEERARVLVSDKEITKRAQKMAVELVNAAQAQAKKINNASAAYCENILKNSEEVLARSVADIKNTRMNLRNLASRGPHGPQKPNL